MASVIFKPRALNQVLSSATSEGVLCTILLSNEGCIVAHSSHESNDKNFHDVAAMANNIWSGFNKGMKQIFDGQQLECVVMDCLEGNVVISRCAHFLLCSYANKTVELGMLRSKAQALVSFLEEPLKSVASPC